MRRMILRLLVTSCGKSRCRTCREGIGHGPYWYADWYEGRAYKRSYIGKDLPLFLLIMSEQTGVTTRAAWVEDPERLLQEFRPEPPPPKTVYRLQRSLCGKRRCRKCWEGTGHGPYWYAYRTVNGRTTRTYVGKQLPESLQKQLSATIEEGTVIEVFEAPVQTR